MATENGEDEEKIKFVAIKSTLNSILRPQYATRLKDIIFDRSVVMTKISALASLLILYKTNSAVDRSDEHFFWQNGKGVIYNCFHEVTQEGIENLPEEFRDEMDSIHENQFEWPSKRCLGNSFNYFKEQYVTNLTTNLNTHLEKRLQYFLRMRCFQLNLAYNDPNLFDGTDVRNILKDVLKDTDWTDNDAMREHKRDALWEQLIQIGFPANTNLKEHVKQNWFASMWPLMKIQREIEEFLIQRADEIEQWELFTKEPTKHAKPIGMRPPTVRNFTVIPNCNAHLKHIKIDISVCYKLTGKVGAEMPKFTNEKTGRVNKIPVTYYTSKKLSKEVKAERTAEVFDISFDMDKIRRNGNHAKQFYGQIVTDGISASVIYEKRPRQSTFSCLIMIVAAFFRGLFLNVIGVDPGDKTWIAGVRRNIWTRVEVSSANQFENLFYLFEYAFMKIHLQTIFKISPRRFHWGTKEKMRRRKIDRLSAIFTAEMRHNLAAQNYPRVPSPRGASWRFYMDQQMHLLPTGMDAFATRKYGRLLLDKYIQTNRECDEIAKQVTQNEPSLVMLGAAELHPSRPIGIKGRLRCPGSRKLVTSLKKLGNCAVMFIDEYFTSQTCANCFSRFNRNTRRNRFKVCMNCKPAIGDIERACLPTKIITQLGKRALKEARKMWRNARALGIQRIQPDETRLVSKVVTYQKNWQPTINGELNGRTVVWHRDIVAARCILYKGTLNFTQSLID